MIKVVVFKAYQYLIYPTDEQQIALAQHTGNVGWYWNYALNLCETAYPEAGKGLTRNAIQQLLSKLKKEYEWLGLCYSQCLQVVALKLSTAYKSFFEIRSWQCPKCCTKHDRNIKAATNTREEGLRILAEGRFATAHGRPVRLSSDSGVG
ncbi:MAG: helix-turn-helix domain-containing protein [Cyanophyceae cyanobacterium]